MVATTGKTTLISIFFCTLSLNYPVETFCRPLILSGASSVGSNYNSNIYNTKENHVSEWETSFSPSLTLRMPEEKENISLSFSPSYSLNHRTERNLLIYNLAAHYDRDISPSSQFQLGLSGDLSYSDKPAPDAITANNKAMQFVQLESEYQNDIVRLLFPEYNWPGGKFDSSDPAQRAIVQEEIQTRYDNAPPSIKTQVDSLFNIDAVSRRHYWSGTAGFSGSFEYSQGGLLSFGYFYSKSGNDTSSQSDSDSHGSSIAVKHQLSEQVDLSGSYNFTVNNYDRSDNSKNHNRTVGLGYKFNHANILTTSLSNSEVRYSGEQNGNSRNGLSVGFEHKFSPDKNITFSANPYRINQKDSSDERGYNLAATFNKTIERGSLSFGTNSSHSESQTAGGWDDLRESWVVSASMSYNFIEKLNSNVSVSYGEGANWTGGKKSINSDYAASLGLSYPLNKWVNANLDYSFNRYDTGSDQAEDYYNNMIALTLSASGELWRR